MSKNYRYDSWMNRYEKMPTRAILNQRAIEESESVEYNEEEQPEWVSERLFRRSNKTWIKETQGGNWFVYRGQMEVEGKFLGCFCGYVNKDLKVLRQIDYCYIDNEIQFVNSWDAPWVMVENFTVWYEEYFYDLEVKPYSTACVAGTVDFICGLNSESIGLSVKNFLRIIRSYDCVAKAKDNPIKPSHKRFFDNCMVYLYRITQEEYDRVSQYFRAYVIDQQIEIYEI